MEARNVTLQRLGDDFPWFTAPAPGHWLEEGLLPGRAAGAAVAVVTAAFVLFSYAVNGLWLYIYKR